MFFRSQRLFLRPGWPEDWAELFARIADESVVRNLAAAPWPYTAEDARAFVAREQAHWAPHFLVTLPGPDGAEVIGCAGLGAEGKASELGYWIAREYWGHGYATEAVQSILQVARMLGHHRITASHFVDNPASGRVLTKAGFRREGRPVTAFSQGRGGHAPALSYVIDLAAPDGSGEGDDGPVMRRAA